MGFWSWLDEPRHKSWILGNRCGHCKEVWNKEKKICGPKICFKCGAVDPEIEHVKILISFTISMQGLCPMHEKYEEIIVI